MLILFIFSEQAHLFYIKSALFPNMRNRKCGQEQRVVQMFRHAAAKLICLFFFLFYFTKVKSSKNKNNKMKTFIYLSVLDKVLLNFRCVGKKTINSKLDIHPESGKRSLEIQ